MESSATETTQLSLSNESSEELRRERYDETGDLIGATSTFGYGGIVGCWHVPLFGGNNRMWPISCLLIIFSRK
jgi:hypothetical protein